LIAALPAAAALQLTSADIHVHGCSLFSERDAMARPPVCRLSVTFVHPTQAIEIFGNISTPFITVAIC